jgi:hypothetical protein
MIAKENDSYGCSTNIFATRCICRLKQISDIMPNMWSKALQMVWEGRSRFNKLAGKLRWLKRSAEYCEIAANVDISDLGG